MAVVGHRILSYLYVSSAEVCSIEWQAVVYTSTTILPRTASSQGGLLCEMAKKQNMPVDLHGYQYLKFQKESPQRSHAAQDQ